MATQSIIEDIEKALDHEDWELAGRHVGRLVGEKRRQYGNALEKSAAILTLLFPGGIQPVQYVDACSMMRVLEKLSRVASGDQGDESAWIDIAGHGLVAAKHAVTASIRERTYLDEAVR